MTYNPSSAVSYSSAEYFTTIETNLETGLDEIVRVPVENVIAVNSARRNGTLGVMHSEDEAHHAFVQRGKKERTTGDFVNGRFGRPDREKLNY